MCRRLQTEADSSSPGARAFSNWGNHSHVSSAGSADLCQSSTWVTAPAVLKVWGVGELFMPEDLYVLHNLPLSSLFIHAAALDFFSCVSRSSYVTSFEHCVHVLCGFAFKAIHTMSVLLEEKSLFCPESREMVNYNI